MQETVGLFCRISPAVREVLSETLRGMNEARAAGDPPMKLGALIERCIVETLSPPERAARAARIAGKARRK